MAYIDSANIGGKEYELRDRSVEGKLNKPATDGTNGQILKTNGDGTTAWIDLPDGVTIDATLTKAGESADAKAAGDKIRKNEQDISGKLSKPATDGTNGQILKTNGNGTTAWIDLPDGVTIDATLTKAGEAADAKAAGDKIDAKVSKPENDPDGQDGQVLVSNGDGTTRWEDFSGGGKDIKNAIVTLDVNRFTYDGTAKKPTVTSVKADGVTLVENRDYVVIADNATNAGEYYITVVGIGDYSGAAKKMFEVDKAAGHVSIDKTDVELNNEKLLDTITVIKSGDGAVTASSSDTEVATVSVSGDTVTITAGTKGGTATITISVAEGTNHTASNNVTCTVKHLSISPNLSEVTPDIIQSVAKAGTGESYWSVGDKTAPIAFNSVTVGALDMTGISLSAFIIGFNHNSEIEGEGIHFQFGKTETGTDVAFADSYYGQIGVPPESVNCIRMNRTGTCIGGWQGSYMRNTVCADFLLALPGDWYNVIKECKKYTDNAGNGNIAADVTETQDKIFILSEYELRGVQGYANTNEANFQEQYPYYKNGNSKIKVRYPYDSQVNASYHLRSPALYNYNFKICFCSLEATTPDIAKYSSANISTGFAPCFVVG